MLAATFQSVAARAMLIADCKKDIDRAAAPTTRVLGENGEQLVVRVPLIEPTHCIAVWKVAVGRSRNVNNLSTHLGT